jgi:AcrR family transcriptional regulator
MKRTSTSRAAAAAIDPAVRGRVLQAARAQLLNVGFGPLNMGELATELGMSKKTLYLYFESKEALVRAIIDDLGEEVRSTALQLLNDPQLAFSVKVRRFIAGMIERISRLSPAALRDVQRRAPELYHRLEEMRAQNISLIFGQFIAQGQRAGLVREDVQSTVAVEFLLRGIQGTLAPEALRRLELPPSEVFENVMNLFFGGLLTTAGRKDYERNRSR